MTKVSLEAQMAAFRKSRIGHDLLELLFIFICLSPYAIAVNMLLVPHNIVGGGLTGLSEILYFATNGAVPIYITVALVNILLLIVAIWLIGWKFCVRTIWGVFSLSFWLRVIPIADVAFLSDPFMACIISGLFCGASLGVVYINNGSTGGTDIIAMIINKYKRVSIGRSLFICDLVIISSAYFLPNIHSVEPLMMGLVFTFMAMLAVDYIMNNAKQSVQFFIFSIHHAEEIADAINHNVNRGVTLLDGQGGFSKKPIKVVTVLAKKYETKQIFDIIKAIDPNAFVSQTVAQGVYGKGFDTVLNKKEQERARQLEIAYEEAQKQA